MEKDTTMTDPIFLIDDPKCHADWPSFREHWLKLKEETLQKLRLLRKKDIYIGSRIRHSSGVVGTLAFNGVQLTAYFDPPGLLPSQGWDVDSVELQQKDPK